MRGESLDGPNFRLIPDDVRVSSAPDCMRRASRNCRDDVCHSKYIYKIRIRTRVLNEISRATLEYSNKGRLALVAESVPLSSKRQLDNDGEVSIYAASKSISRAAVPALTHVGIMSLLQPLNARQASTALPTLPSSARTTSAMTSRSRFGNMLCSVLQSCQRQFHTHKIWSDLLNNNAMFPHSHLLGLSSLCARLFGNHFLRHALPFT